MVYGLLVGLALASALLAGHAMAGSPAHPWLHMLGFAAIIALAVYIILDLEYPRLGLISFGDFDQAFVALRQSMQ